MPATEAIRVTCSHCDAHFKVKPEAAGRSANRLTVSRVGACPRRKSAGFR